MRGESGLTLRVVTDHLSTGRGAIYHHVTNKDELLAAAADGVIGKVLAEAAGDDRGGRFAPSHWASSRLREHDDRAQFLAGVDIFLAGVSSRQSSIE